MYSIILPSLSISLLCHLSNIIVSMGQTDSCFNEFPGKNKYKEKLGFRLLDV